MMTTQIEKQNSQIDRINEATLTKHVQSACKSKTIKLIDWEWKKLHGGVGEGNAVYRFFGNGSDKEEKLSWSLILKTIHPTGDTCEASSWNYSKREPEAYQSGFLDDLPGGLAAPRNFSVIQHPDGTYWIWLEDVKDDFDSHWPLEHYGVVARHLGQFNGSYLVNATLPSFSWLSSDWLRRYIELSASAIPLISEQCDHPIIRIGWPKDSFKKFISVWNQRNIFFDALDRLPQTLCHNDLFRRNLFARKTTDDEDETVVIDWSYVGYGAIGQDLVPLVFASVFFNEIEFTQIHALEKVVFEGYLQGLEDVGWKGDPCLVRLGYTGGSIRYRFCEIEKAISLILDASKHTWIKEVWGCSVEEVEYHYNQIGTYIDQLAEEARELMKFSTN
jgi:hypothetical protein